MKVHDALVMKHKVPSVVCSSPAEVFGVNECISNLARRCISGGFVHFNKFREVGNAGWICIFRRPYCQNHICKWNQWIFTDWVTRQTQNKTLVLAAHGQGDVGFCDAVVSFYLSSVLRVLLSPSIHRAYNKFSVSSNWIGMGKAFPVSPLKGRFFLSEKKSCGLCKVHLSSLWHSDFHVRLCRKSVSIWRFDHKHTVPFVPSNCGRSISSN